MKKYIHGANDHVVALLNEELVKDGKWLIKTFSPDAYRSVWINNKFGLMLFNDERKYNGQDILDDVLWNESEVGLVEKVFLYEPVDIMKLRLEEKDVKDLIDYYYEIYQADDAITDYIENFVKNERPDTAEELLDEFYANLEEEGFDEAYDWLCRAL